MFDYMVAFFEKLEKEGINTKKIEPKIKHRLRAFFLGRVQGAALPSEDSSVAREIYEEAKALLGQLISWI